MRERYILALVEENIKDVEKFGDEKVMKEYISEAEKASHDRKIEKDYDYELSSEYERFKEGKEKGLKQGKMEVSIEIVKNMLKDNVHIDTIRKYTGLSNKEIENITF